MGDLKQQFMLRPGVVFLNHGSFGACPRPVFETYQSLQAELEQQPVEFMQRKLSGLLAEARSALGRFVGADPDDLVFVTNATTGISIIARALPLEPGDEVLSTDHEYGSVESTWQFVCQKRGAHYRQQSLRLPVASADEWVDTFWAGVTPRTRVITFSHITAPTALILPVEKLVRRAREAGITTVIDGAHAPGQVALDLSAIGADFYVGNCHKWMMAPKGAGFLFAHREHHGLLEPLIGPPVKRVEPSVLVANHQLYGTRDHSAALSVPAAIRFMEEHDWPAVRARCYEQICFARSAVEQLTRVPAVVPESPDWFSQMAVLPLPPCDPVALKQQLWSRFNIEIPTTSWEDQTFLRLSVQAYNSRADVEHLVNAVACLLPEVRGARE